MGPQETVSSAEPNSSTLKPSPRPTGLSKAGFWATGGERRANTSQGVKPPGTPLPTFWGKEDSGTARRPQGLSAHRSRSPDEAGDERASERLGFFQQPLSQTQQGSTQLHKDALST